MGTDMSNGFTFYLDAAGWVLNDAIPGHEPIIGAGLRRSWCLASLFGCGACGIIALGLSAFSTYRSLKKGDRTEAVWGALDFVPFGIGRVGRVAGKVAGKIAKRVMREARRGRGYAAQSRMPTPNRYARQVRSAVNRTTKKVARYADRGLTVTGSYLYAAKYSSRENQWIYK